MTRRTTTTKAEGSAEGGEDKVTYNMWVDYRPVCYVNGMHVDTPPSPADAKLHAAYTALVHLEALFGLLSLANGQAVGRMDSEDLGMMLQQLGDLGRGIVTSAYSHVEEVRSGSE